RGGSSPSAPPTPSRSSRRPSTSPSHAGIARTCPCSPSPTVGSSPTRNSAASSRPRPGDHSPSRWTSARRRWLGRWEEARSSSTPSSWGCITDQSARRWADDDGEHPTPPRPAAPHPLQRHAWPSRERLRELDLDALHRATLTGELGAALEVITGSETGEALQQVGAAL